MRTTAQHSPGFTLIEILVSISIFAIVFTAVSSVYVLGQKTYEQNNAVTELSQNGRSVLDRMTREIRQARTLVAILPSTQATAVNTITFQDGHDTAQITYIRYYLSGTQVYRQRLAYYFSGAPDDYVLFNSLDAFGNPAQEKEVDNDNDIIGEFFSELSFWGEDQLVNIATELSAHDVVIALQTAVYGRSL